MLNTTWSSVASASRIDNNEVIADGGRAGAESDGSVGRSDTSKKSTKSKIRTKIGYLGNNNNTKEPKFPTSKVRESFNYLRQVFTKAPIFWHFYPESHTWIETNASKYTIRGILS